MSKNYSNDFFKKYINEHIKAVDKVKNDYSFFKKLSHEISLSLKSGGTIFWCGNGGSMADASHLAAELMGKYESERKPLKSIALGQDSAVLSCIANDFSYEKIFSRELLGLAKENDYLIILSTSGNSKNIVDVANTANNIGMKSFSLLGKGGGQVKDFTTTNYIIDENKTSIIQEVQKTIGHLIVELIENDLDIV